MITRLTSSLSSSRRWLAVFVPSLLVLFIGHGVPAAGQGAPPGGWVTGNGHSPFVNVVQTVKDAVVNISAEKVVDARRFHSFEPFFEDWFGPDTGRSRQKSLGSGFIFRPDGYILTNYHVVNGADNITVRLSDKMELRAELVGTDRETDLAVLQIKADHELPAVTLGDSDSILVGDWAVAVGNPFPQQGLDRTVTVGVISAVGRKSLNFGSETPTYQDYIQTDASINPGNSGGPLVNLKGEVIGINAAIASPTGANVGIGFAIPVNFAKMVIPDLLASGRVPRGWLGIQLHDVSWDDAEAEGLETAEGAIIDRVMDDTPAQRAELKPGDVIVTVNDEKITDTQQFMRLIWQARAGTTVRLGVLRNGRPQTFAVTLEDRDRALRASSESDEPAPSSAETLWLGIEVTTATPQLAVQYESEFHPGVLVTDIDAAGPAYEKGIRIGMIIAEINHEPIRSRGEYEEKVAQIGDQTKAVSLLVYGQQGQTAYIAVRPARQN
ncbi:MAG: Do family serine endopeptidase [Candidatus Zixiibacteriota bacterium]